MTLTQATDTYQVPFTVTSGTGTDSEPKAIRTASGKTVTRKNMCGPLACDWIAGRVTTGPYDGRCAREVGGL